MNATRYRIPGGGQEDAKIIVVLTLRRSRAFRRSRGALRTHEDCDRRLIGLHLRFGDFQSDGALDTRPIRE